MNNEHGFLFVCLQVLTWDSKLASSIFFFFKKYSSVCYFCLEFLVVGRKVKQDEKVVGAECSSNWTNWNYKAVGIIQQLKTVELNYDLFSTHHTHYIPNVKDSFFYIVSILHPEIVQSIDDCVIINFLKSHDVLTNYSFVQ